MADEEMDALPEGQDTFDRAYVEKLREEAARYRTALKPYKESFGDFNESEKHFLFGMIQALNGDPKEGARQFRDMAKNILNDEFFDGIDLPEAPAKDEDPEEVPEDKAKPTLTKEKAEEMGLTPEQLRAELDARDKAAAEKAAEREAEAKLQSEIEAVYKEIEDAGFQRGTEAFQTALSLGATMTQQGKDVVFSELAAKVRYVHDLPEPDAPEAEAEEKPKEDVLFPHGSGKEFAKTASTAGVGGAGEPAKNWVQEAKEQGLNPMQIARERAEARLNAAD